MDIKCNEELSERHLEEVIYKPINYGDKVQQLKQKYTKEKPDTLFLYFTVLTASILILNCGCQMMWLSPVLPQLRSNNSDINPLGEPVTTVQISLLAGLSVLSATCGLVCLRKLPDVIGRKKTIVLMSLFSLLSTLSLAFARHIYVCYFAKSVLSLCSAVMYAFVPMYISEICEDHNRAKHGILMMFFYPLGNLYAYLVGSQTTMRTFTLLCGAPLIFQIVVFFSLAPESPIYTASKKDKGTTIETLKKLRNTKSSEEIENDFEKIDATLSVCIEKNEIGLGELLRIPGLRRGFVVGVGLNIASSMSGVPIIMQFFGPLFNQAGTVFSGNQSSILGGTVKLICFFITVYLVGKLDRKFLLLFSSLFCAIFLFVFGIYFYLKQSNSPIIDSVKWLPIACIVVHIFVYSLGLGSIPVPIVGELFPNEFRALATSYIWTICNIFQFISSITFPLVCDSLGPHYFMWSLSICCFSCFAFIYYMLPQTKGKTLSEIHKLLGN